MDRLIQIRIALAVGPVPAGALCKGLGVTRPTMARAVASISVENVTELYGLACARSFYASNGFI